MIYFTIRLQIWSDRNVTKMETTSLVILSFSQNIHSLHMKKILNWAAMLGKDSDLATVPPGHKGHWCGAPSMQKIM